MAVRKTAEQMNEERRLVKAKRRRNAKNNAAAKLQNKVSVLQAAAQEKHRHLLAVKNGERLLERVNQNGKIVLTVQSRTYQRDVSDLIKAAKKSGKWFQWNPDWESKGAFVMVPSPTKRHQKAA